ncbi:growth hormone secretagogue receptor type 1-like [Mytilus trossulus]|uniref:growth hormone secretagogue receptor type 1-like n=1 Tax=Mytilus trossulus TaxID=6551 RepID=UPI003007F1BD
MTFEIPTVPSAMFEDSEHNILNSYHRYMENTSFTTVPFSAITNCSTEDWIYPKLLQLSRRKAVLYLPVIIFQFLLMIVGCFGNALVLYIYCFRSKKRSANNFIIAMALFDFITSVVVMPIDIYDLLYHYSFYSNIACKIFRAVENATTYASAVILIQIAFDRYFKICKPLRFGNRKRTKCMSISAGMLALILSSPAVVLFGTKRERISGNLCGFDCSVDQKYKDSTFQMIYYLMLGLVFLITLITLSALYFLIWLAIKRRKDMIIGEIPRLSVTSGQNGRRRMLSSESSDDHSSVGHNQKQFRRTFSNLSTKSKVSNLSEKLSHIKASRTTKIFIAVTIAFIVSYLPSVGVMICRTIYKKIEKDSSGFVQVLLKLFSRCNYLNNAVNPIIYSFLNKHFRVEVTKLTKSIGVCWKKSYKSEFDQAYELEHLKH